MRQVAKTAELLRIADLPRRDWQNQDLELLTNKFNKLLIKDSGSMQLRPIQAAALKEIYETGLCGQLPVGCGKTLISLIAPIILKSERPLLLIPAKLRKKTEREIKEYSKHFHIAENLKLMNYEILSRINGQERLKEINPDCIIADEAHRLKNLKAACTRRITRWMKEHPNTTFIPLSGTFAQKSIMNYAHMLRWALKDRAPIPTGWKEAMEWSLAIDENLPFMQSRYRPGSLMLMANDQQKEDLKNETRSFVEIAREVYRDRLVSTPGVLFTHSEYGDCSLIVNCKLHRQSDTIENYFDNLRSTWQTPDGLDIMEAADFWSKARQLSSGFFYRLTEKPPEDWKEARRIWASFVRKTIGSNRRGWDSEKAIANAAIAGECSSEEYNNWKNIRDSFKPEVEAIWLSDTLLEVCAKWAEQSKGIIWTEHVAFGKRLSEFARIPYFGQMGLDEKGNYIEDSSGPIIASIAANSEGRNLQYKWNNNLIVSCPPNGATWEQLIGRTHRSGQEQDEVFVDILMGCHEHLDGFNKAYAQAKYTQQTSIASDRDSLKLLVASIDRLDDNIINDLRKKSNAWKV